MPRLTLADYEAVAAKLRADIAKYDAALEGMREDIAKRYRDRRLDNYSARQIAIAEAQRRETRTITLSACEVNDFALDDAELAALVRRRWQEATT